LPQRENAMRFCDAWPEELITLSEALRRNRIKVSKFDYIELATLRPNYSRLAQHKLFIISMHKCGLIEI
jgi:hypothetical protein